MPRAGTKSAFAACVWVAAMALSARDARADGEPTAIAESLFRQGKSALERGDVAEACTLLSKSQSLEKRDGTLLLLATCHERAGRTATAWSEYRDVEAHGRADRAKYARSRAVAIEPRLAYVKLQLRPGVAPGSVRLTLDHVTPVDPTAIGARIPVDPGAHELAVEGPDHTTRTTSFSAVSEETTTVELDVGSSPAVATTTTTKIALAPAELPSTDRSSMETSTVVGIVGSSLAVVGIGVGAAFGIHALSLSGEALDRCGGSGPSCTDPRALELRSDANLPATVSTIAFVTGGVALLVGVGALLLAPHAKRPSTTLAPTMAVLRF